MAHNNRHLVNLPNGALGVISLGCEDGDSSETELIAKTLFELSRDMGNTEEHFDPAVHTLDAIATGIPGHASLTYRSCLESDLPIERVCRDAWEWATTKVAVTMAKARIIHMDRIRQVRDVELEKLDVPFLKALESGDTLEQQRIAALKNTLRDIPETFDLAKYRSPATLKASWPPDLPRP